MLCPTGNRESLNVQREDGTKTVNGLDYQAKNLIKPRESDRPFPEESYTIKIPISVNPYSLA